MRPPGPAALLQRLCGQHAGVEEFSSLAAFAQAMTGPKIHRLSLDHPADALSPPGRHRRQQVPSLPGGPGHRDLDTPAASQFRYATIDGRPIDRPIARIDGLSDKDLPFLTEPYQPIAGFFPWKTLEVEWGPCSSPLATEKPLESKSFCS